MTISVVTQIYLMSVVILSTEVLVLFFTILDFLKLDFLKRFRISYDNKERDYPSNSEIVHALKVSYSSVLRIYCLPMLLSYVFDIGMPFVNKSEPAPEVGEVIGELMLLTIMGDITLYLIHRLFHTPWLFKNYHIKHHRDYTYTFAAIHHFFDDFEGIVLALAGIFPVIIFHVHFYSYLAWLAIVQLSAIIGHSGYQIPGMSETFPIMNPRYHDGHHKFVGANYGAIFTWTDRMFGTLRLK